jgi:hypothetical protein
MPTSRSFRFLFLAVVAFAAGGCASDGNGPRERELARLERIERFAGAPVDEFRFWKIDRWEGLGPDAVAVWTKHNEAWLMTVRTPCTGLEFAMSIGVSSTLNRVRRLHDEVLFERQRCRIEQIRPIDVRAMRAELAAQAD